MKALHEKIRKEGQVLSDTILKVDAFLNHQIDAKFMMQVGKALADRFKDEKITKIITIETSGIAPAMAAGYALDVPVVFAKKSKSVTMNDQLYVTKVKSFTKGIVYDIQIAKKYIHEDDRILIIDDFLAYGNALVGIEEMIKKAGAYLVGAGIVIEKGFQKGGDHLRSQGMRIESLAIVEKMDENRIIFR